MSNITPEDNNELNRPADETPADSNPIGRVPDALAQRLSVEPRTYTQGTYESRMLTALDQIRYLNDRIRVNTETTAKFLSDHMRDLTQSTKAITDTRTRLESGITQPQPSEAVFTRDQLIDLHKKRFDVQFPQLQQTLQQGDFATQISRLREIGMVDEAGALRIGRTRIDPGSVEETLKNIQTGQAAGLAAEFNKQLESALTKHIATTAPDAELEFARGVANMASGHGLIGRISETLHLGHGMSMHVQSRRPLGATPETSMEGDNPYDDARVTPGEQHRGFAGFLARAGSREGRLGGIARGTARFLGAEGRLGALIPQLAPFLVGYELLRNFGRDIPVVGGAFTAGEQMVVDRFGRQALQTGQLTGEGRGAGFAASQAAIGLTPGGEIAPTIGGYNLAAAPIVGGVFNRIGGLLHPFDPVTREIAEEIVQSVRTQGFTGPIADQLYKGVASVYRDLGLSVQTTTQMITDAMRNGGESFQQIVTEMKTFDDAAHNLSININDYAESISTVAGGLRSRGTGAQATSLAQAFVAGLPRNMRSGQGLQDALTIQQNFRPLVAAQLGVPQQLLDDRRNAGRAQTALGPAILGYLNSMPGRDVREQAEYASNLPGTLLSGVGVDEILSFVNRAQHGRGLQAQGVFRQSIRDYQRALTGMETTQRIRVRDMTEDQLRRLGITHEGPFFKQHGRDLKYNAAFDIRQDVTQLSTDQYVRARQATIDRLRKADLISKPQQDELEKLLRNRDPGAFLKKLTEISQKQGPGRNLFNTRFGTINITMGKGLRKLVNVNTTQRAVQGGLITGNKATWNEDQRFLNNLGP